MKKILVLGAGRSASTLIQYLLSHAEQENWTVTVGDYSQSLAARKTGGHPRGEAVFFDVNDAKLRQELVQKHDIVVSLLPAEFHPLVAWDCVHLNTHLVTASYVSPEMQALDDIAKQQGIILLNELGVDPGIDHLSAMEKIDEIHAKGGKLIAFKSYCGALIAPECNNEWGYKFTWSPRNVILAGQATAKYLRDGKFRFIPYNRLFLETEDVEVPGYGKFEAYANRDSLRYTVPYGLQDVPTLLRGTLRVKGYCRAWNAFIRLGLTEDVSRLSMPGWMSWRDLIFSFINPLPGKTDAESLAAFLGEPIDGEVMRKLIASGILSDEQLELENATAAALLQHLLEKKWKFMDTDTDLIVMQHQFVYEMKDSRRRLHASMAVKGTDSVHTAISATVGLPAAMAVKLILQGRYKRSGVRLPVTADLYKPILEELKGYGVNFVDEEWVEA